MKKMFKYLGLLLLIELFFDNHEAMAYINPGSGSYIFQTVIGGVLGAVCFVKKLFLSLVNKKTASNNSDNK